MDIDVIVAKVNKFETLAARMEEFFKAHSPELHQELLTLKADMVSGLDNLKPALRDLEQLGDEVMSLRTELGAAFNGLKADIEGTNERVANLELAVKGVTSAPSEPPPQPDADTPPVADVEPAPTAA